MKSRRYLSIMIPIQLIKHVAFRTRYQGNGNFPFRYFLSYPWSSNEIFISQVFVEVLSEVPFITKSFTVRQIHRIIFLWAAYLFFPLSFDLLISVFFFLNRVFFLLSDFFFCEIWARCFFLLPHGWSLSIWVSRFSFCAQVRLIRTSLTEAGSG